METRILERGEIRKQPHSWYKILCAPTHSLIAALSSVLIMFLINWIYSLVVFLTFILLVYYIHITAPGLAPGLAVNFSFLDYINFKWRRLFNKNLKKDTFLIISPPTINSRWDFRWLKWFIKTCFNKFERFDAKKSIKN